MGRLAVLLYCAQGILAGVAVSHLVSLAHFEMDANFLKEYATSANGQRRLFYILTTISLIAAVEKVHLQAGLLNCLLTSNRFLKIAVHFLHEFCYFLILFGL